MSVHENVQSTWYTWLKMRRWRQQRHHEYRESWLKQVSVCQSLRRMWIIIPNRLQLQRIFSQSSWSSRLSWSSKSQTLQHHESHHLLSLHFGGGGFFTLFLLQILVFVCNVLAIVRIGSKEGIPTRKDRSVRSIDGFVMIIVIFNIGLEWNETFQARGNVISTMRMKSHGLFHVHPNEEG